ncbi:hypothetical protein BD779DRAFT_105680 [Infundibulicybe gibba]|nr:hypothetical protein BD779DRAFT_105680 [Infundibulicybe gibba]
MRPFCPNAVQGSGACRSPFFDIRPGVLSTWYVPVYPPKEIIMESSRIVIYMVLSVLSTINLAITIRGGHKSDGFLISTQRTFHSILSARMLLHLRHSSHQSRNGDTMNISLITFRGVSSNVGDGGRMSAI